MDTELDNPEPVTAARRSGQPTILVCDDDPMIRLFAGKMLQHLHYAAILTDSGQAALESYAADGSAIQAVMLDFRLPDLSAQAVIDRLEAINPAVRILVCSGYKSDASLGLTRKTGPLAYLAKPYTMENMSAALVQLLPDIHPVS